MYSCRRAIFLVTILNFVQFFSAIAQFPPIPENVTVLNSKFNDGVYISYKEVPYSYSYDSILNMLK